MRKGNIPYYDICNLAEHQLSQHDLLAERFGDYLKRHAPDLHNAHRHSFYHLVLFTKGRGSHSIDFNRFKVRPFDIYFMIPGQVHSWQFSGAPEGYIINFSETFFKVFLSDSNYLDRFPFFTGNSEEAVYHLPASLHNGTVQLFESILQQLNSEKTSRFDMIRLLLLQIFITINDVCATDSRVQLVPQQKRLMLNNFRKLIDQHYLSLKLPKEYADLLYITPNHLNALCQDLAGKTAGEFIRDRTLLEAKRLLTNADLTITEIAFMLNFHDNSYFARFFKKNAGIAPETFRKKLISVI